MAAASSAEYPGGTDDAYVELAREIRAEVARVAADGDSGTAALEAVFAGITDRERQRTAREVFDRLPAEEQWAVIERVFDDAELEAALASQRAVLVATAARRAVAAGVADGNRLDTVRVPIDGRLTLGLFREADVHAGMTRGPAAANCTRRLGLLSTEVPGTFQVMEDVFNPNGGFFVTGTYDQITWEGERLVANALVRPGSIVPDGGDRRVDPVLHLGGRVDVEVDGDLHEGRLHLGYARLDEVDVFEGTAR